VAKIFISYSHVDQSSINEIKSVRLNSNHNLSFFDNSLSAPIYNGQGHVNRRPPADYASIPVREEITKLLLNSEKLLVILGNDTHSKLWVEWEIEEFKRLHRSPDILVMRTRDSLGGAPRVAQNLSVYEWDLDFVSKWVNR
jgi:hypothetical protein